MKAYDVHEIAEATGIWLEGTAGHPYHCGARMETRAGVVGVDFALCKICGLKICRIDSPHTNGGQVLSPETLKYFGDRVWFIDTVSNKQVQIF